MTKAYIALLLLVCAGIFSCTKPDLAEETLIETQACCGEDEHNPPPDPDPDPDK